MDPFKVKGKNGSTSFFLFLTLMYSMTGYTSCKPVTGV
jgi:hypothetical protein